MAFRVNIEKATLNNTYFRRVLDTTETQQLVVMHLEPGEEIGMEVHPKTTQSIRIEKGVAEVRAANKRYRLKDGDWITIHPNTRHNVWNASKSAPLKLYTIYSPPEHQPGTKQKRRPVKNE